MGRWGVLLCLVLLVEPGAAQTNRRTPVVQVVEKVRPAVVNLTAKQVVRLRGRTLFDQLFPEFAPPREYETQSLGSGVVISPDGLIVTNEHVIAGAAEISVRFLSGRQEQAEVVGSDADSDLALLRVNAKGLPFLPVAEQDDLMIGETVLAIGNPLGLENTVTVGVLSARDRTVSSPRTNRVYTDFLQTDASINPGNSGGALVDLDGRLIGINTAIVGEAQGIGFAIPAKRVRRVVADLLRYGRVQPAWLGIFVRDLPLAQKGRNGAGIRVVDVFPASPADGKLAVGDVILSGNGRALASRDDFATLLAQVAPGERVELELAEGASSRRLSLRATTPPENLGEQLLLRYVGVRLTARRGWVVVQKVLPNTPAEEAGFTAGVVLLAVNGQRVQSLQEVNQILTRDYLRSSVLLVIGHEGFQYHFTFRLAP
ncbi:MAG: trypsin-like peptidase domain-containing protein [Thermoanaerobaculum sp.]|nr:trypsin-like peptidase domain-containing protein [Thermoanaerobaculum sp.]MDW7966653.1 trypsin-like peptidase domain-containing protein [Thermoanaerobaculum sp.]